MLKNLNSWIKARTLSNLKVIGIGFLFSILLANCNSGKKVPSHDPDPLVNWLDVIHEPDWDTIPFTSDPDDSLKIRREMRNIRVYVRGWLAEYNDSIGTNYIVDSFNFALKTRAPLRYTIKAFLNPPARSSGHGPGGHLIPPPPPPPGKGG